MTAGKRLVLDANILIRAVLGTRVIELLRTYEDVEFITADVCVRDAERHIALLSRQRSLSHDLLSARLETILCQIQVVDASFYAVDQATAKFRLASRDIRRLADPGYDSDRGLPYLDRGQGLFRRRRGDVDDAKRGDVSA